MTPNGVNFLSVFLSSHIKLYKASTRIRLFCEVDSTLMVLGAGFKQNKQLYCHQPPSV